VLEEALAWADACLIGGRTLRLHGSTCLIHAADLLEERRSQGRSSQPDAVVVSRCGRFDPELRFFRQPLQRRLLLSPPQPAQLPAGFQACHPLNTWADALAGLADAGLRRLVLLGGAELAGQLLAADQVDQLQLTVCPMVLGGRHSWLPAEVSLAQTRWQLLEQRPLEGEELLLRYGRLPA
jgi:5-amino-6-(5-phosphoribosylamino)uracil reductase